MNAQGIGHEANATAPDLAVSSVSAFTPSAFASALWNHTPAMWREISAKRLPRPVLAEADWDDVFAYLYSERIFQFPARRGGGKRSSVRKMRRLPFPCYTKPRSRTARFRLEKSG